jgi:hypothetical protein
MTRDQVAMVELPASSAVAVATVSNATIQAMIKQHWESKQSPPYGAVRHPNTPNHMLGGQFCVDKKTVSGIDREYALTLNEIGEEFNLTRERVRQIKEKAIKRLQHKSRSRKLQTYLG